MIHSLFEVNNSRQHGDESILVKQMRELRIMGVGSQLGLNIGIVSGLLDHNPESMVSGGDPIRYFGEHVFIQGDLLHPGLAHDIEGLGEHLTRVVGQSLSPVLLQEPLPGRELGMVDNGGA
jgi:hypothetical protein